ncbi:hypothetical protein D1007_56329 [Hordeum vulgare]|nr:hypothetical protein D1007_56329 [Hordeum vulgare]
MPRIPSGLWEGSMITVDQIAFLRWTQKLPSEEVLEARAPGNEIVPRPQDGERIVFASHFLVGFGLPTSSFLRQFLGGERRLVHCVLHHHVRGVLGHPPLSNLISPLLLLPQPEAWHDGLFLWRRGDLPAERPADAEDAVPGFLQEMAVDLLLLPHHQRGACLP